MAEMTLITNNTIMDAIARLSDVRSKLYEAKETLANTQRDMKVYRWRFELELISRAGSEKALGGNEAARERTVELALEEDPDWQDFLAQVERDEHAVFAADVDVEVQRAFLRLIPTIAEVSE